MTKTRKYTWRKAIIAAALLFGAAIRAEAMSADQLAEMLGILRNSESHSISGERWIDETLKTLHKLTGKTGVSDMIKIGAPVYRHIRSLTERGEPFGAFPELVAAELSKVAKYGGAELRFDGKSHRYAKNALLKAASYLPAEAVQRIPTLEALTVIGRGLFRQYTPDMAVVKTNGVKIALHELGHALEHSSGHLLLLRKELYENRTRGNKLRKLNCGFFPFGYRPDEKYRAGFVDRYMGKEDGVEIYSCGVEYVFFNRHDIWRRDPEMTKFILGSLIYYGSHISGEF